MARSALRTNCSIGSSLSLGNGHTPQLAVIGSKALLKFQMRQVFFEAPADRLGIAGIRRGQSAKIVVPHPRQDVRLLEGVFEDLRQTPDQLVAGGVSSTRVRPLAST